MQHLHFSTGNAKLDKRIIFSLPAAYTCPNAGHCKTFADRATGKILDLPQSSHATGRKYRCFAAMSEARSKNCRSNRWENFDAIKELIFANDKSSEDAIDVLTTTILHNIARYPDYELCRIHESGDFWSEIYFRSWLEVARRKPSVKFYGYTKQLNFWLNAMDSIPDNMYLTASVGGNLDPMLKQHGYKFKRIAYVVYTEDEADALGLEIDHDDSHCFGDKPFALLVHGSQRAGSDASKALSLRKRQQKWTGYSKK